MPNYSLPPGSKGTIPTPDAAEQTANWRDYIANTDLITKAVLFPIETINNLLKTNPDADAIRVYFALKTAGDPKSLTALIVPVIDGKDIPTVTGPDRVGDDGDDDNNVFNFGTPCPPDCDDNSPLG